MSQAEADSGREVTITGVVTAIDTQLRRVYVQDAGGAIGVDVAGSDIAGITPGTTVEVAGITAWNGFVPSITARKIARTGQAPLPPAEPVEVDALESGRAEGHRVALLGIARAATRRDGQVELDFKAGERVATCVVTGAVLAELEGLDDAHVRIEAVVRTRVSPKGQPNGFALLVAGRAGIHVIEPPTDAFALPVQRIPELVRLKARGGAEHRIHVHGTVTRWRPGHGIYIKDGPDAIYLDTPQSAPELKPGDRIDAIGFVARDEFAPLLEHVRYRSAGRGDPPRAVEMAARQVLEKLCEGDLVRVTGVVVDRVEWTENQQRVMLTAGGLVFGAQLDPREAGAITERFGTGARLAVTGIVYLREIDQRGRPRSFDLLLRNAGDVEVLARPNWWTPYRVLSVVGTIAAVLLAVIGWGWTLRRRVRRQTEIIRAQVEQDLRMQSRYRELFDGAGDMVFTLDREGRFTALNRAGQSMTGYSAEEAAALSLADMAATASADAARAMLRVAADGQQPPVTELELRRRDGRPFTVEIGAHALFEAGELAGLQGIGRDVTARREAERELQRAKETAEAASRAKSQFVANMSHEIRTPMNGVIGMTTLAMECEGGPEQREYLQMARDSAEGLLTIINDILDYSKIESGRLELAEIDFDLHECVAAAIQPLAVRAGQKGIELVSDIGSDVPEHVAGDPSRLRQVLLNLVGNAVKFTEQGEIVVRVRAEGHQGDRLRVAFSVADTGIGIEPSQRDHVFRAFEQADSSTTRRFGGTGLGLTISRQLVEAMGGTLEFESVPGEGSTFHFSVLFRVAATSERVVAATPMSLEGIRVLVVDDNATNRRVLGQTLCALRMDAALVGSGAAAIAACAAAHAEGRPFRLAILDVRMAGMDGFELAAQLRREPANADLRLLMLSSAGQPSDAVRARALGVSDFLLKPVRRTELAGSIAAALDPRGGARTAAQGPGAALETGEPSGPCDPPQRELSVLVVDDNPINRRLIERMLSRRGHRVTVAEDGPSALAAIDAGHFDIVLMDVQMPGMSGYEVTSEIRRREQAREGGRLPVIAITANAMRGDMQKCLDAGMDDYLSKPVQAPSLEAALARHTMLPAGHLR